MLRLFVNYIAINPDKIFCLWLLLFPLGLKGQNFPVDGATGQIYFAEEILVKDAPQTDLYNRAKTWFNSSGKLNKKLKVDDARNGVIIGSYLTVLDITENNKPKQVVLKCTLKIELADDQYWYRLYDFKLDRHINHWAKTANHNLVQSQPLEYGLFGKEKLDSKTKLKPVNKALAEAAQFSIQTLLEDLKGSML